MKADGLYRKFEVRRVDGTDAPGAKHHNCHYFVLDIDHDPHAVAALRAYAESCAASLPELADDLKRWADNPQGVGEFPVTMLLYRERPVAPDVVPPAEKERT